MQMLLKKTPQYFISLGFSPKAKAQGPWFLQNKVKMVSNV